MSNFLGFGKKPTARETARENKKELKRSEREINREISALDRQERQLIADIKRSASQNGGNDRGTRALAKQLVQLRSTKERLTLAKVQIGSSAMQVQAMAAQATMAESIGKTAAVMKKVNAQTKAAATAETMQEFLRQQELANVREELVTLTPSLSPTPRRIWASLLFPSSSRRSLARP